MAFQQPGNAGSGEPRMFDLNRPQGSAKDEYLFQWMSANSTVFDLIRRNNNNQNTRDIVMAVMFSISLIAHDDLRRQQEILFHAAIDYINAIPSDRMTVDQKADEIMRVCAITMGNLTSYVDQFRGLAHTLKVGELVNLDKAYAQRTHAFPQPEEPPLVI
jgi:hypothetical protein